MKLKGGVIIIGSLIWEQHLSNVDADNIRKNWRKQNLLGKRTLTKVPIRYGRESQKRNKVYTMVFSKSCESTLGQGLILPFNDYITIFEGIERQAVALAIAEGIYKNDNLRLTSNWGSVGLLVNPNLKNKDFASYEFIRKKWSDIYNNYKDTFVAINYKTKEEQESVISQNGFLNICWQNEMSDFDLLIATPVIPKPKSLITGVDIAQRMIEKDDHTYYLNNRKNKITTKDDNEIQFELDKTIKKDKTNHPKEKV